jgi:hypothetical protein
MHILPIALNVNSNFKREQKFEECVHWVDQYVSSNKTSDGRVPHIDVEDKV